MSETKKGTSPTRRKLLKVAALGASTVLAFDAGACSSATDTIHDAGPLVGKGPCEGGLCGVRVVDSGPLLGMDSAQLDVGVDSAMPDSDLVGRPPEDGGTDGSLTDGSFPDGCEVGSCDAGIDVPDAGAG